MNRLIKSIRDYSKDFIAIALMVLLATVTLLVILANQKAALPGWIPGLGQEFYSINAEFETAQAITPGQGQAAVIAGINVGKVGAAELENGVAKVRLDIEPRYRDLLHQDAEFLLRPKTGLNDMVVEIDPGTTGPPPEEGSTLPLAQGLSNVQLDYSEEASFGDTILREFSIRMKLDPDADIRRIEEQPRATAAAGGGSGPADLRGIFARPGTGDDR